MTTQSDQVEAAIAALAKTNKTARKRLSENEEDERFVRQARQDFLNETVESDALPTISPSVLRTLKKEFPLFVTPTVERAFFDFRKILGIFPRSGSSETLRKLQIQLASHLDQTKFGELPEYDNELKRLIDARTFLVTRANEATNLLALLTNVRNTNAPLPADAFEQVSRITAQDLPARTERPRSKREDETDSRRDDDDDREWSSSSSYGRSNSNTESSSAKPFVPGGSTGFDGGGASGNWSDAKVATTVAATAIGAAAITAAVVGADAVDSVDSADTGDTLADASTAGDEAIATDDSLGAFS